VGCIGNVLEALRFFIPNGRREFFQNPVHAKYGVHSAGNMVCLDSSGCDHLQSAARLAVSAL